MAFLLRAVRRRPVASALGASAAISLYGTYAMASSPKVRSWVTPYRVTEVEGGGLAVVDNDKWWFKRFRSARHIESGGWAIEANESSRPSRYMAISGLDVSGYADVSKSWDKFWNEPCGILFPTPLVMLPVILTMTPLGLTIQRTPLAPAAQVFLMTILIVASYMVVFGPPNVVQVNKCRVTHGTCVYPRN